jgi:hypothetical protein
VKSENESKVFGVITHPLSQAAVYLLGLLFLITAHKILPTDLAGPGLDALVFLMLILAIVYFFVIGCFDKGVPKHQRETNQCIHVIGIVLLLAWMMNA